MIVVLLLNCLIDHIDTNFMFGSSVIVSVVRSINFIVSRCYPISVLSNPHVKDTIAEAHPYR